MLVINVNETNFVRSVAWSELLLVSIDLNSMDSLIHSSIDVDSSLLIIIMVLSFVVPIWAASICLVISMSLILLNGVQNGCIALLTIFRPPRSTQSSVLITLGQCGF